MRLPVLEAGLKGSDDHIPYSNLDSTGEDTGYIGDASPRNQKTITVLMSSDIKKNDLGIRISEF